MVILALLPAAPSGLSGGGSGGTLAGAGSGETYAAVDLYALPAPAAVPAVKPPEPSASDALDEPANAVKPVTDALQTAVSDMPQLAQADPSPLSPASPASSEPPATGGPGQAGTTAGAGDDLWSAIAPCWKRIAGKDTLNVTLRVTFTAGGLSKPPEIERADGSAITPQSLRSEAQALTALAQCGAYRMAAGRQGGEVNFPRPD